MIAEREQDVVLVVLEAVAAVGGDHDAAELVVEVDRDRHEVLDLVVGGRARLAVRGPRVVLAHRLVTLDHALRVVLGDRGVPRVVLEALGRDQVQPAVMVVVLARPAGGPCAHRAR